VCALQNRLCVHFYEIPCIWRVSYSSVAVGYIVDECVCEIQYAVTRRNNPAQDRPVSPYCGKYRTTVHPLQPYTVP
jgi:hypothetical protein